MNDQSPVAFVVALPAFEKLPTGNSSLRIRTVRPLTFAPVSLPDSVTLPPDCTEVGDAAIVSVPGAGLAAHTAGTAIRPTAAIVMIVRFMHVSTPEAA